MKLSLLHILSHLKRKKKGCLYNKTPEQKNEFFKSLYSFKNNDPVFFWEQFNDLLPHEKQEFLKWIEQQNEILRRMKSTIFLLAKLLKESQ